MPPIRKPKPPVQPPVRDYGRGYVDPSKQRVDINISTGRPNTLGGDPIDQQKQGRINSTLKRLQKIRQRDPRVTFTAQGPSDFYGIGRDDISQIVATRMPETTDERYQYYLNAGRMKGLGEDELQTYAHSRGEGRVVGDGNAVLDNGRPNRTFKPDEIVADLIRKYEAGQERLTIDELAGSTSPEVTQALFKIGKQRPEILKKLSVYLAGGPGSGPGKFDPELMRFLGKHKTPVYVQMYGGRLKGTPNADGSMTPGKRWGDKQWDQAIDKFGKFREMGVNAKPLMSLSDKHIGDGPASINEARQRAERIFEATGYIPSVWHATSARAPAPEGMGAAVDQWIRKMRRQ